MKHAAHAYRYDTESEPEPDPRSLPVVVDAGRRSSSIAGDDPKFQLIKEWERFSIVMWDEV